jgi:shikimate kinase
MRPAPAKNLAMVETAMLRYSMTLVVVLALGAGVASADVYKFTDEKGNVLYTDKPATLPAQRLNVQSQKTDVVEVQQRQKAEMERLQAASQTRQQNATQQADQRAADELTAKDKADRCIKARERYDSYMNSQRLYQTDANGERKYLSDEELTSARTSAKASMEELCK